MMAERAALSSFLPARAACPACDHLAKVWRQHASGWYSARPDHPHETNALTGGT